MRSWLALSILSLIPLAAAGETCKYVDKEGHIIYSNVPVKNARKVNCFQPPAAPPPESKPRAPDGGAGASNDANKRKVEPVTQRSRDVERRRILEEELAREQQALADARKTLAEQEATRSGGERNYQLVLDRLKPYQEAVAMHEKNVTSLRQELANVK